MRYLLFVLALIGAISATVPVSYATPDDGPEKNGFTHTNCGHLGDEC